jgi:hypothetical protein
MGSIVISETIPVWKSTVLLVKGSPIGFNTEA